MTKEEMNNRCVELAEDHWDYIEGILEEHSIPIKEIDIARFHYNEAFKHGYKHCWEDMYVPGQIILVDNPRDYELSSNPNPQGNQAS